MSDLVNNHIPISPEIETAMRNIGESFIELRITINKTYYGQSPDIKTAVNRLLGCVMDMVEVVE